MKMVSLMKFATIAFSVTASVSAMAAGSLVADVTLNPAGDFKAKTSDVSGEATVSGDTVKADNIVVKLNKLVTGMPLRDRHAKEKYMEVNKYPEAVLTKATGQGGKGKGMLKFHGVEKEVSGTYKIEGNMLKANFPIKLSDFKISGINYMGVGVEDEVKVEVSVPVKK